MSTKERIKKFSKKTLDKCIPFIKLKDFTEPIQIDIEEAKDCLIYGFQAERLEKGKRVEVVVYSSEFNEHELVFLDKVTNKSESLDLKMLMDISFSFREEKFWSYSSNGNNNDNNNKKSKKGFSCFGNTSSTKKNIDLNKNGGRSKADGNKSKKICCLGGGNNDNGKVNTKKKEQIKNTSKNKSLKNKNNNIDNNNNISMNSNSSIEKIKCTSQTNNINSSNTQNTLPDNNTNKNKNTNNNYESSELASAAKRFTSFIKSVGEKINLLFKSEQDLKTFAIAIFNIYQVEKSEPDEQSNLNVFEKYLKKIWQKFDVNQTQFLEYPFFLRMIKLMDQNYNFIFNVNLKDEKAIKVLFEKLDKDNFGKISFEEFSKFYNEIIAGSEFEEVFLNYSKGKQHLNFENLSEFMITEQKQFIKSDEIAEIFLDYKIEVPETPRNIKPQGLKAEKQIVSKPEKFCNDSNNMKSEKDLIEGGAIENKISKIDYKLNLMEFKNFISDKSRCCIFNLDAFEIQHDMSRPLNDYFVFSSHNTFLNKNIYGEGSLEMFNYAINEGCRMLQLECYDGETEPKISQASSLSEVLLKDALLNIRENSFKTSKFPVLISLENYCKKEQQIILAQYLREILKDIFTLNSNKLPEKYPSPKDLEGKFIIKEVKTVEISRKSSLPIGNIGNIIKETDTEYNFNYDFIDNNNSKYISNSLTQMFANGNKDGDEELMHFLNFYNLDLAYRNEDLFDYEAFEDIPEENIYHNQVLEKHFSFLDRKAERSDEQIRSTQNKLDTNLMNKINTYGHIVINEWIEKSNTNAINKSMNNGATQLNSLTNTTHALSKCNSMTLNNKSSKSDLVMNMNIFNKNTSNNTNNTNNNKISEDPNEEDDRLPSANRSNNAQRKKMCASFLSEIKEKEDDFESSYKKHCRSRDSDGLTLIRYNSKFSDSNVYNNRNQNSDSSNRLTSLLHFSINKNLDLSSQNRSSHNRSSKKTVNVSHVIANNHAGGVGNNNIASNNNNNNNNNKNAILNGVLNHSNSLTNTNANSLVGNSIANTNFFSGSNIIINNHNVNINLNTSPITNNINNPNIINNPITNNNNQNTNNNNNNISNNSIGHIKSTNISNSNTGLNILSQNNLSKSNHRLNSMRSNKALLNHSKTFANERQQQIQKPKNQDFSNTIKEMQDLAGLVKKRFYLEKLDDELFYNPWDCPAIRESELHEIFKNFHLRNKLVKYCKNSFLKVQPNKTSRISTINFDPVKAWICGIQIAAINIQSLEDDFVLITKIFFRFNKGCGYVLKPEFLRNPSAAYERHYLKPLMKLKVDIISCLMLQTCVRNLKKRENIFFESYLVGSWEDDKMNPKHKSKSYEKNLINLIFDNESLKFDVYEPELCFWIIKIYLSNTVIARSCVPISVMNEGIRVVPLFDLNCNEFPDCVLLARVVKKGFSE